MRGRPNGPAAAACPQTTDSDRASSPVAAEFGVELTATSTVLVVSPHLDDAALSVGGTIAALVRRGVTVEVLTLFAGQPVGDLSPAAKHFHDLCAHRHDGSAIGGRRAEDRAAMRVLGARWAHGDFLDAVYRTQRDGQWLCRGERAMFSEELDDECYLVKELSAHIAQRVSQLAPDVLLTCAAHGGHVDHRHALAAAGAAADGAGLRMFTWEDLPYAIDAVAVTPQHAVEEARLPLRKDDWTAKLNAVAAYVSQIRMLWPAGDWASVLTVHAMARGSGTTAELLWEMETGPQTIPTAIAATPRVR